MWFLKIWRSVSVLFESCTFQYRWKQVSEFTFAHWLVIYAVYSIATCRISGWTSSEDTLVQLEQRGTKWANCNHNSTHLLGGWYCWRWGWCLLHPFRINFKKLILNAKHHSPSTKRKRRGRSKRLNKKSSDERKCWSRRKWRSRV